MVVVATAPHDPRFPSTNQARHCYTRFNEYYRCLTGKHFFLLILKLVVCCGLAMSIFTLSSGPVCNSKCHTAPGARHRRARRTPSRSKLQMSLRQVQGAEERGGPQVGLIASVTLRQVQGAEERGGPRVRLLSEGLPEPVPWGVGAPTSPHDSPRKSCLSSSWQTRSAILCPCQAAPWLLGEETRVQNQEQAVSMCWWRASDKKLCYVQKSRAGCACALVDR